MTRQEILAGLEQLYNKKMLKKKVIGGIKFDAAELKAVEDAYAILSTVPDKYFDAYNDKDRKV